MIVTAVVFVNTVTVNTISTGKVNTTILPCESVNLPLIGLEPIDGYAAKFVTCGQCVPSYFPASEHL